MTNQRSMAVFYRRIISATARDTTSISLEIIMLKP
jgi:hypothetical protein